jgi:hypothetical protein
MMVRRIDIPPDDIHVRDDAANLTERSQRDPAAAEAWLSVFTRLLHLPEPQRLAIRAELEAHIHERTRDLMLDGCDERSATRQAIDELGEIAQLARRFDAADRPHHRSTLMQLAIISAIATATVTGAVLLKPSTHPQPMRMFEQKQAQLEPPADVGSVTLTMQPDMSMASLVELILRDAKLGVSVDWDEMEEIGLSREMPLGMGGQAMPLASTLQLLAQRGSGPHDRLAWRFRDRMLVLASAARFDREETVLTSADVAAVIVRISSQGDVPRVDAAEQLVNLITQFVEPECWVDNGGSLAKVTIVGGKMFVEAPPRIQERVAWIIGELGADAGEEPQARSQVERTSIPLVGDVPVLADLYRRRETVTAPDAAR